MHLSQYFIPERVLPQMTAEKKRDALLELASLVSGPENLALRDEVARVLADRERLASTAIGEEVAIPHGKLESIDTLVIAFGRHPRGLEFESVDGRPTRLFFVLVAPGDSTTIHLKALSRISRLCKEPGFRQRILTAVDAREIFEIICSEDEKIYPR
jgi:nitrogen PTS system EIIA component